MNRIAAFAGTAAHKIRRSHHYRHTQGNPLVDGRNKHGLAAAARSAGYPHSAEIGFFQSTEIIEHSNSVQTLYGVGHAAAMASAVKLQQLFIPGKKIVTDRNDAHPGLHGTAQLLVGAITAITKMTVGIEHNRTFAFVSNGMVY